MFRTANPFFWLGGYIVFAENVVSMRARRATTLTESPRFFRKILIILLLEAALNVLKNR